MTYAELKETLRWDLVGGMAHATNESAMLSFFNRAKTDVMSTTEPLYLITTDQERFVPYRWLDEVFFIREMDAPLSAEEIDIDPKLQEAILYFIASAMSQRDARERVQDFRTNGEVVKDDYRYQNEMYLNHIGFRATGFPVATYNPSCKRQDLALLLEWKGLLKYYRVYMIMPDTEWAYDWQDNAVRLLDDFMRTSKGYRLTPSHEYLWGQLASYEASKGGGTNINPDVWQEEEKAMHELDKIFLERSGVWQI